jgi:hypothetical protein
MQLSAIMCKAALYIAAGERKGSDHVPEKAHVRAVSAQWSSATLNAMEIDVHSWIVDQCFLLKFLN